MKYPPHTHHRAKIYGFVAAALLGNLVNSLDARAAQGPARPVAIFQFNSDVAEIPPHVAWNAFSTGLVKSGIFTVVTQNPAMAQYGFDGFVTEVKAGQGKADFSGILKGLFVTTNESQPGVRVEVKVVDVKTGQILDTVGVSSADLKSKFGLADVGFILQGLTSKNQSSSSSSTRPRKDVLDEAFANCIVEVVNKISTQAAQYQNMASAIPPPTNQQAPSAFGAVPPTYSQQPGYNPYYSQPAPGYPSSPGYPPQAPMASAPPGYAPNQPAYGYPSPMPPQGFPPTAGGGPQPYPANQPPGYGYPPQMGPAVGTYPPPAPEQTYPPVWGGGPGSPQAQQPAYGYPPMGVPQGGPSTGVYPPPPLPSSESGYPPTARGGPQGYPSNQPAAYGQSPGSNQPGIPEYPSTPPPMPQAYGGQPGYPPNAAGAPGYPQPGYPPQQMPPGAAFPPQGGAYPPQGQAAPPPGWR